MPQRKIFSELYDRFATSRLFLIVVFLCLVAGLLFYFDTVRKSLEEREEKYARLYAESISFFIEKGVESSCDYTFVQEVLTANETVPTILVVDNVPLNNLNIPEFADSTKKWTDKEKQQFLNKRIVEMADQHKPISFSVGKSKGYVYYSNSNIVTKLNYFPYILIATFLVFGFLAYIAYSSSRRAEQNRVWVGLAKETAHQLGTPISGLMGWIEVLKINPEFDRSIGDEMLKDIERLETITNRFSNIGSVPVMKEEDIGALVEGTLEYLKKRISTKIIWSFENHLEVPCYKNINRNLFEWVVENLCKNAVDAMTGVGSLNVSIRNLKDQKVAIEISDTGKGMSKQVQRNIFNAGFSTKKRGWGLGLTLAKRIIETYHHGQIFVSESTIGKGSTFRIIL